MEKKEIAKLVFEAMNKRDLSLIENHLSDNVNFDFPGVERISGKRKVLVFMKMLLRKYSELQFAVNDAFREENKVCLVWTNIGQLTNGNLYNNSGVTVFNFEAEKIIFLSDYFKDTSFVE
ncbi:MAG: nuclear transport factor 2 family protein [Bacteroidales bacterium]|nr:nuclear transport factor 2 family protein [Bacteroidales bacterium]